MDNLINFYKAMLFILNEINDTPNTKAVVDTRTLKFYYAIGEGNSSDIQLQPIGDYSPTNIEYDMSPENHLSIADFAEKNGKNRVIYGKFAEILRKITGAFAEHLRKNDTKYADLPTTNCGTPAENLQNHYGENTETQRKIIGKKIIDRNAISHFAIGELRKILNNIEKLTDSIVRNTQKADTIKKTAERFDAAVKIFESNDVNKIEKLREIETNLKLSRQRQLNRHKQNTEEAVRNNPVRQFKIWAAAVIIASAVITGIYLLLNYEFNNTGDEKKYHSYSKIESTINLVADKTNTKIWKWRKNKIHKEIENLKLTETELEQNIELLITKQF